MRLLMNVTVPHEPFNTAVRDGSAGEKLERILKETRPEAVCFTEQKGHGGAILIFDLADPSKIPAVCEPWFLTFGADIAFRIVMTLEDIKKSGLAEVGQKGRRPLENPAEGAATAGRDKGAAGFGPRSPLTESWGHLGIDSSGPHRLEGTGSA